MRLFRTFLTLSMAGAFLLATGCASISNFQTGKPLGKGNAEGIFSVSNINTINGDSISIADHDYEIVPPEFTFFELQGVLGITDRIDIGIKYTFPTAGALTAKYCLVGAGKEKGIFLSPGLRAGYTAFPSTDSTENNRIEISVPVYLSLYFTNFLSVSLIPTYSGRYFTSFSSYENCLGGNFNLRIGKRFGFVAEAAYQRNLYWNWDELQFGGSIYFPLPELGFLK